jgi:hypothetical protein
MRVDAAPHRSRGIADNLDVVEISKCLDNTFQLLHFVSHSGPVSSTKCSCATLCVVSVTSMLERLQSTPAGVLTATYFVHMLANHSSPSHRIFQDWLQLIDMIINNWPLVDKEAVAAAPWLQLHCSYFQKLTSAIGDRDAARTSVDPNYLTSTWQFDLLVV